MQCRIWKNFWGGGELLLTSLMVYEKLDERMMLSHLEELNKKQVVDLDEERKAAMVSNLLVVLCGNHDAQPIVNSGSLY